jgi:dienelactone hydrolase
MSATAAHPRTDVGFVSGDAECRGWLYRPQGDVAPLVILGHGLGATREMGLDAYAERFQDAGLAALCFTYRFFGDSGGLPRQLLDIDAQLADWAAALAYARGLAGVDPARIAIWGSSFGGGHVIEVAARDGQVAAVVSQCPFTDGVASIRAMDSRTVAGDLLLAARDELRRVTGASPVRVPVVGPPGSSALMTAPDAESGYRALIPPGFEVDDQVAARIVNRIGFYRPGRSAARVTAPILFCICERDSVAPAAAALRHAAQAPRAELKRYPIGHFDIYKGEPFETAVRDQTDFLQRHLGPTQSP